YHARKRQPCARFLTVDSRAAGPWCTSMARAVAGAVSPTPTCLQLAHLGEGRVGYAISVFHSAKAADRRALKLSRLLRWRSWLKWLWKAAWTELNFCKVFIWRKRSMARSRRRNGRCEFSHRLLAQRPICCFSPLPRSFIAARYERRPSVTMALGRPWRFM